MNEDTLKFIEWYDSNIYITGNINLTGNMYHAYDLHTYDLDTVALYFSTLKEVFEFYLTLNK